MPFHSWQTYSMSAPMRMPTSVATSTSYPVKMPSAVR